MVILVVLSVCAPRSEWRWLIVSPRSAAAPVRATWRAPSRLSLSVTVRVAPAATVNRAEVTALRAAGPVTSPRQVRRCSGR